MYKLVGLILPSLILGVNSLSAQLDYASHAFVIGDSLVKQQVVYCDPGSRGKELTWNFTFLQADEKPYIVTYQAIDSTHIEHLCAIEHQTRYYYNQFIDSVWCKGYENSTTYMHYHKPELLLTYPFHYGDTLFSHFAGEGEYGHRIPFSIEGSAFVEADAEGELRLPDGVIHKALRTHTERHYMLINGDSVQITQHIYRWYTATYRYPVLESISFQEDDSVVLQTSFYYYPVELLEDEDDTSNKVINPIDMVFTDAEFLPNPVISSLYIGYTLTRSARVRFCLYTTLGMPLYQSNTLEIAEGQHSHNIDMSAYATGSYTLYIFVDDMLRQEVIIKK